jgi:enoyl-[acyl-carrier protein] reductase II
MKVNNRITRLLGIRYPIIQGGMVWVSGWKLASAVSNCGGLGLIGAGSMKPELLKEHIIKCKAATNKPVGVNIPLFRTDAEDLIKVTIDEGIKIIFPSAGSPAKYIDLFKKSEVKVIHVVANVKQGLKAQDAGCDVVVGEGVEAGGHNGSDEMTTFCLIPQLVDALKIPVIAAGGIADGRGILAALSLGAEGVQIGTRFAVTVESSASETYKQSILNAGDTATVLAFKKTGLVRMLKNKISDEAGVLENNGASAEQMKELLGTKREMKGIFEGDTVEGMMETGQGAGLIKELLSVNTLFEQMLNEFDKAKNQITIL